MQANIKEAILSFSEHPIGYRPMFGRIAGGATNGLFLSQLFYWTGRQKDPHGWIYKSYKEWEEETCLSRSEIDRARRDLKECGLLEDDLRGIPATLYYRLNLDKLAALAAEDHLTYAASSTTVCTNEQTDCKNQQTDCVNAQTISETTTETTTQTTTDSKDTVPVSFQQWLSVIKNSKNVAARLRWMFATLYPDATLPSFPYIGKAARKVGGSSRLAQLMWEHSTRPPVGDVLAYFMKIGEKKESGLKAFDAAMEAMNGDG